MPVFSEPVVEDAALAWREALVYEVLHGPEIFAGSPGAERSDLNCRDVLLDGRLPQARARGGAADKLPVAYEVAQSSRGD